ncbi:hypothetical protein K488DRAFT_87664 [Vararia minispora EC-137]|uniref:Uncharacterized protein n=1 Tax=Vararia minispora EC-137 TaxID=1314806 RepID=A0ACB8QFW3_9AGAM|nr:hypothetical protein K488DRAFT_87664 [Vararia minispora EC-137]
MNYLHAQPFLQFNALRSSAFVPLALADQFDHETSLDFSVKLDYTLKAPGHLHGIAKLQERLFCNAGIMISSHALRANSVGVHIRQLLDDRRRKDEQIAVAREHSANPEAERAVALAELASSRFQFGIDALRTMLCHQRVKSETAATAAGCDVCSIENLRSPFELMSSSVIRLSVDDPGLFYEDSSTSLSKETSEVEGISASSTAATQLSLSALCHGLEVAHQAGDDHDLPSRIAMPIASEPSFSEEFELLKTLLYPSVRTAPVSPFVPKATTCHAFTTNSNAALSTAPPPLLPLRAAIHGKPPGYRFNLHRR